MEYSTEPTAYAVECDNCGLVYLTHKNYMAQLSRPDSRWFCPRCGENASWSDEIHQAYLDDFNFDV